MKQETKRLIEIGAYNCLVCKRKIVPYYRWVGNDLIKDYDHIIQTIRLIDSRSRTFQAHENCLDEFEPMKPYETNNKP